MNPFDAMQNLADLWNKGGQAYLTAQQGVFTGMADTMAKAAGLGDKASFQAFTSHYRRADLTCPVKEHSRAA